ncbi:MAG: hypothetical protein H8E84_02855 [Flavobacteriales bacterium]|nr:hypothetical protein [Flavobacteriales bacterium]
MKKTLFIILLFFNFNYGFSQDKKTKLTKFSDDKELYIQELEGFLTATKNKDLIKVFSDFEDNFESGKFEKESIKQIIHISNVMLSKRLRANPHFLNYLKALNQFAYQADALPKLNSWLKVVDNLLEESTTKRLILFFRFTEGFISSAVLRDSRSAKWFCPSTDYTFEVELGHPYLNFYKNLQLSCSANSSTIYIYKTKGKYWPLDYKWEGEGGVVDWQKVGYHQDSVYVILANFNLNLKKAQINADSVLFYNKYTFNKPIVGSIKHKIEVGGYDKKRNYPYFKSKGKDVVISGIFSEVDYKGGYILKGKSFIADGGDYAQARIILKRDGKPIIIANANRFSITKDRISSELAAVKVFFDTDSIYHSALKFTFINSKRKLELFRARNGVSESPLINTYHQITMDCELLEWNIDQDMIFFGSLPGTSSSTAYFESSNNYLEAKYQQLHGMDKIHPLILIRNYIKDKGEELFFVEDFARYAKFSLVQIQHYLTNLSNKGFIYYDYGEQRIRVLPKLHNYLKAKSGKGDYDVISFKSQVNSSAGAMKMQINSALNITTKDLNVLGVPKITLSDSQKVYMYPSAGRIVIKQNRDFVFSGKISTGNGRFNLFGEDFYFHYDSFWVDLKRIDSLQLSVPLFPVERDMYGDEILTKIKTVIEAVTGDLQIDHPTNKSGLRKDSFPGYPIFKSYEDSYAYYDKKSIYNGVYNKDRVSFHLQPFSIDSLENFTGKGLWFAGTFQSAGIFPVFDDTLRLQEDYSLGFKRETPDDGFDVYGGKAKYYNEIQLSNKGIKGSGKLEYLSSTSIANNILFFPDSTNLHTEQFNLLAVKEGIEFPEANNTKTYVHFMPYKEVMNIYKKQEEFSMYDGQTTFDGDIELRPTALTGNGIMKLKDAEVSSNLFKYNAIFFNADTADLIVNADNIGGIAFESKNLRTHIDLQEQIGMFYSNGSESYVQLPENQYICYIDQLKWDMKQQLLELGETSESSLGTEFVSSHPQQDSVSFIAKTATYSLKDYVIHANGVEKIEIADAIIYPDSGMLIVEKKAQIRTLEDATIVANTLTEYHTFKNTTVYIKGKNKYTASGEYTYKDELNKEQNIFFSNINVNDDNITIAKGSVDEESPFKLGAKFSFKGDVNLIANDKYLTFDGYFKMDHQCSFIPIEWVKFKSEISPDNITLKLDSVVLNDDNDRLTTGLMMGADSSNIYSSFLNRKNRSIDIELLTASYFLYYDKNESAFVVSGYDTLSNVFWLYDKQCKTKGNGLMDLGINLGRIEIETAGFLEHSILSGNNEMRLFMLLDFFFSEKALRVMADDIFLSPGIGDYDFDSEFYSKTLGRITGKEQAEVLLLDLEMRTEFDQFPEALNHTMSFTDLQLKWDEKEKAYFSDGVIGLGSMGEVQLNSMLEGFIKIKKGRNNDILTIYLLTESHERYYFNYKSGVMRARSSNPAFNEAIQEMSEGKRKAPHKGGIPAFRYQIAPGQSVDRFVKEMEKRH